MYFKQLVTLLLTDNDVMLSKIFEKFYGYLLKIMTTLQLNETAYT